MLLNILTVFQLLRYARVLTVANFASCDYFSYLSRYVWTNMLQYPLQWYLQFYSEDRRVMHWIMKCPANWKQTTLKFTTFECSSKTFVFLVFGTFFSLLVTLSMVSSARSFFLSVFLEVCFEVDLSDIQGTRWLQSQLCYFEVPKRNVWVKISWFCLTTA